jgi:hypothetical protein
MEQRRYYERARATCEEEHRKYNAAVRKWQLARDDGRAINEPPPPFTPTKLVMAIDGAAFEDGVPTFCQKDKNSETGHKLMSSLTGSMVHDGSMYLIFTMLKNVTGGQCNACGACVGTRCECGEVWHVCVASVTRGERVH